MTTTAIHSLPIRERLRHAYLRSVIVPALRAAGTALTDHLARRVGRGFFRLGPPIRAIAMRRAERALSESRSRAAIERIVARSFEHAARFWGESLFIRRRLGAADWPNHVSFTVPSGEAQQGTGNSLDRLMDIVRQKRGCILTTAYFGNPVAAAAVFAHVFGRIHVLADFDARGLLDIWTDDLRRMPQIVLIKPREATRRIPAILDLGGTLLTIGEHHRPRGGVRLRWLGAEVNAGPTLGHMAIAGNTPIVPFLCARAKDAFRFQIDVLDCIEPEAAGDDPHEMVRATAAALERGILARPEQYLWAMPETVANPAPRAVSFIEMETETASFPSGH